MFPCEETSWRLAPCQSSPPQRTGHWDYMQHMWNPSHHRPWSGRNSALPSLYMYAWNRQLQAIETYSLGESPNAVALLIGLNKIISCTWHQHSGYNLLALSPGSPLNEREGGLGTRPHPQVTTKYHKKDMTCCDRWLSDRNHGLGSVNRGPPKVILLVYNYHWHHRC